MTGARRGDKLLAVDGRDVRPMTWGEVLKALHGAPGEPRRLSLERNGAPFDIDARVEAIDP